MTLKQFKQAINFGMGSAILALGEMQTISNGYKDAVLYACVHDTHYDSQCEGERHTYLFEAVNLAGDRDYYKEQVVEKLYKTDQNYLVSQLCGILYLFIKTGCTGLGEVLQKRFDDYLIRTSRIKSTDRCQLCYESAESIAIWLCDIYGISSFLDSAEKIGFIMLTQGSNNLHYDSLICAAEEKFGEKAIIRKLKERARTSPGIKYFLETFEQDNMRRLDYQEKYKAEAITVNHLIEAVQSGKNYMLGSLSKRMLKTMKPEELVEITRRIKSEGNPDIKKCLLNIFAYVDYPGEFHEIITYYNNEDYLKEPALRALKRLKDKRIHSIAIDLLIHRTYILESLDLLVRNFHNDYELILDVLKAHVDNDLYDFHSLAMGAIDIFRKRRAKKAQAIFEYLYHNNPCSICRKDVVELMCRNRILPIEIQREAQYDCCEDTRKLVGRYIKKEKKRNAVPSRCD